MAIPYFIVRALLLIIADHRVIGQDLTDPASKATILVVDDVIVGSCAVELATTAEPSAPGGHWLLEPRPGVLVTVYANCVGQVGRAGDVRGQVVTSEDAHVLAVGYLSTCCPVVFECDIIEERLHIKRLSGTNHIKSCVFLSQRETLASDRSCEHSHSISTVTIRDFVSSIACGTVGS